MSSFLPERESRFEHALDVMESALGVDEVVTALGDYADDAGELALQVFPPGLRTSEGVTSLALELKRLSLKRGLDVEPDWTELETLFARANVRISELLHPGAISRASLRDSAGSTRNRPPRAFH